MFTGGVLLLLSHASSANRAALTPPVVPAATGNPSAGFLPRSVRKSASFVSAFFRPCGAGVDFATPTIALIAASTGAGALDPAAASEPRVKYAFRSGHQTTTPGDPRDAASSIQHTFQLRPRLARGACVARYVTPSSAIASTHWTSPSRSERPARARGRPLFAAAAMTERLTSPAGPWKSNPTENSAHSVAASTPAPTHHFAIAH